MSASRPATARFAILRAVRSETSCSPVDRNARCQSFKRNATADVPELIEAFGWCSTVRDLDEDLGHGLVNVPADVVAAAAAEGATPSSVPEFGATEAVRSWFGAELERTDSLLRAHNDRWTPGGDPRGDRIMRIFHKSISGYVRKFGRR